MLLSGANKAVVNYGLTVGRLLATAQLLFLLLSFTPSAAGKPCAYKVPPVEEVVLGVEVEPHEVRHQRHRRSTHRDYRSLRIRPHYHQSVIDLPPNKQRFINESLLPEAVGFWEQSLMVLREVEPIRLDRKCESNQYFMHPSPYSASRRACSGKCKAETKCGEVRVPDQHLFVGFVQCRFCASNLPTSCSSSGAFDGAGVADTDFVLYVSAVASERCDSVDTVAYAAHCQQEALLDRPIAGHVNLCPQSISVAPHDQEVLISTVKHEILHALGFSAGLYAFYRDPNGNPLTARNEHGRPAELDRDRGYYQWSDKTIRDVTRDDWYALSGKMSHTVSVMVTPNVQREVRAHFGCPALEGAELENQGQDGTRITHWEKRLFENEAMTGTHTQNPVYSRITLALMEDTGWYKANYSVAEPLHWGRELGCDFAQKSCAEWIAKRKISNSTPSPFCDDVKHNDLLTYTTCTDTRDALALCNLQMYNRPLPLPYQNMLALDGVPDDKVAFYGGSVELADYCPYNQEFEWRSSSSGGNGNVDVKDGIDGLDPHRPTKHKTHINQPARRDSRCEFTQNTPPGLDNGALEEYGGEARCLNHASRWVQKKCGYTRKFRYYGAGCYQYSCVDGVVQVHLLNSTASYECSYAGQPIYVHRVYDGWLHDGSFICPACAEVCKQTPSFTCTPDHLPLHDPSDPVQSVPCRAPPYTRATSCALLIAVLLNLLRAQFASTSVLL